MEKNKALFFAQYLGQKVFRYCKTCSVINLYPGLLNGLTESTNLLLRDISQLTDEELLVIGQIKFTSSNWRLVDVKTYLIRSEREFGFDSDLHQVLVRMGVIMTFTYLNEENKPITLFPEQIIGLGWTKIKEIK